MPRFVATHNLGSEARAMFAQKGGDMIAALKEMYPRVTWNGAYIQWETGKTICVWDAPDAESVISGFEQLGIPYEDIYPVEWISPHDMATGG